ncbi:MAG: hypothetical protein A2293_06295 [Elusimicrobia bacterium RIFOXYB2_FULL_49_7]|nr:MAG: hypothetical protein A2293_06295 [Elusimicrobia bacterium RIFOXYB2_FULL_49_7]
MTKERFFFLLKVGITLLFLGLLYRSTTVTADHLTRLWNEATLIPLILSMCLGLAGIAFGIFRWDAFLKSRAIPTTPFTSSASFLVGCTLGFITPGRAGEFGRGICYPAVPARDIAWLTLAEKVYFTFFIMLYGLIGTLMALKPLTHAFPHLPGWLFPLPAMTFLILCGTFIFHRFTGKAGKMQSHFPMTSESQFHLLTLSGILYLISILQFYLILRAFAPVSLSVSFSVYSITLIVLTLFPFSIGNLGVRESCFVLLLQETGEISNQIALSAGIMVFFQNILLPAVLGMAVLFINKKRQHTLTRSV